MALSAKEFAKNIINVSNKSKIVKSFTSDISEDTFVKIRILLNVNKMFIDVYYNSETGKTSFALIDECERIFGADNLDFWHLHPFDNPEIHKKIGKINFNKFIEMIEKRFL